MKGVAVPAFDGTLREIRQGQTLWELGEQLAAVVAAVRETGRPGKLVYTMTVKPAGKGASDAVLLSDEITTKAPRLDRASTVFFATADNALTRHDPRQPELPNLRVVDHPTAANGGPDGR